MKTLLLVSASLVTLAGCSFAARSPEMYRDDTTKVLESKNADIKACYDGVLKGTPAAGGKVTVKFDVQKDGEDNAGKIVNVQVDPAGTTAPPPVAECVTKNIAGLGLAPPDKRLGQASYTYEFSAPPPPPAPAAAAPAAAPKS